MVLSSPFAIIISFLGIYLSKEVVDTVMQDKSPGEVLFLIATLSFSLLAANIANKYLSSCRFYDDIAVFHEGELIQRGSHDTLISDDNGKYHELWNAQAQYYTEE